MSQRVPSANTLQLNWEEVEEGQPTMMDREMDQHAVLLMGEIKKNISLIIKFKSVIFSNLIMILL